MTIPAIVLPVLWRLPATTRAMTARRAERMPDAQPYQPLYR